MNKRNNYSTIDMVIIFFTAVNVILFEVFLSRFFAVIMDYSYVFLIVSLATLGIGIGGYFAYRSPRMLYSNKAFVFTLYFFSLFVVVTLMYILPYTHLLFYLFLSMIPFIFAGSILTIILRQGGQRISLLYAADLAGAGLGAIIAVFLMNRMDPVRMISWIAFAGSAVYMLVNEQKKRRWSAAIQMSLFLILCANILFPFSGAFPFQAYMTSPKPA